jgi:hypothetical protein
MWFSRKAHLFSPRILAPIELLIVVAAMSRAMFTVHPLVISSQTGNWLDSRITVRSLLLMVAGLATWFALAKGIGLYRKQAALALEIVWVAMATSGCAFVLMCCLSLHHEGASPARTALRFLAVCLPAIYALRICAAWVGVPSARAVIIVGTGRRALRFFRDLRTRDSNSRRLLGFVDNRNSSLFPGELQSMYLGPLSDLDKILREHVVDEVLIALPARSCYAEIERAIAICRRAGVEAKYPEDVLPGWDYSRSLRRAHGETRMVTIRPAALTSRVA